ncbi:MAG: monovalent cation/H+ antiporter subunit D family protein [Kiritimatiellae bacterium]|nr:monovalent cation/H+ antiporter subunit D family protein [Kiritimatiellia bacterium]
MDTVYTSFVPLCAVLVSLLAVPLILFSSRHPNLREFWTILAGLIKFGLVLSLVPGVLEGRMAVFRLMEISPGIELALKADAFGVFFAIISSGLWILTSFYSIGYMRGLAEHKQTRYFSCFTVCLSATIGIAFAANLLTFVVFYEILTVAAYPLVIHKETREAVLAGRKYLLYTLTAGVLLIAATAWTYQINGSLDFKPGGMFTDISFSSGTLTALFFLFLGGVGVKAAIMPLHSWLPTAMAAPTPVSALLHAVAVVKAGVFGIVRVAGFVFGPELMRAFGLNTILAVFAGATIILASLLAFKQDNLKRRLAYSTIAHLSYVALGTALLSPAAFAGGIMHIASHAVMKITLFFCAGAIYVTLRRENVSELDGAGKIMPLTFLAFAAVAAGLAGIPPLNGFVSKWYLGLGSLQAGTWIPLAILIISGLLNIGYLFPVVYRAFCKPAAESFRRPGGAENLRGKWEASPAMLVPLLITALFSILLGLNPDLFFHFYRLAVQISAGVLGGGGL